MGSADWSIALGILIFVVAIVFAAIYFIRYKKLFLVAFIASISVYCFSVFYTWDVFELNKNWVLVLLIVSTLLMVGLGKYFSKIELKPTKPHTSFKEKER